MSNGTTGPWADVSRRFAAETVGDVVVCVGDIEAAASRIWWNTEMPSLLEKSGAKSINGVAIEDYRFLYNQLIENGADNPQDKISRTFVLLRKKIHLTKREFHSTMYYERS